MKSRLAVRDVLVATRAKYVTLAQALVRRSGLRVPSGSSERFAERLRDLPLPDEIAAELAPILKLLPALNTQLAACDEALEEAAERNPSASSSR